jgi:uncharacterized protein (TIGR00251 family)
VADTVVVREVDGGARIRLRVKPGAQRDRLIGAYGDCLKVEVRAPPERGKANAAVAKLLARVFAVSSSAVVVVAGAGSKDKLVEVRGAAAGPIIDALREAGIAAELS